jgi:hypothetical protein
VRFAPSATVADGTCPRCTAPLHALAAHDAIGHPLSAVQPEWAPGDLAALAHAVAHVMPAGGVTPQRAPH